MFTLRTLVKLPRPLREAYPASHRVSEGGYFKDAMCAIPRHVCHPVITMVESACVHEPNSGAGRRVGGTKTVLNFCCTCSKMQSNAEFKGLEVNSLAIEHIQVNRAPKMRCRVYRAYGRIDPYVGSPCPMKMTLTEKEQIVPKPEEETAQKKKIFHKKLKKQNFWLRNKCCKK